VIGENKIKIAYHMLKSSADGSQKINIGAMIANKIRNLEHANMTIIQCGIPVVSEMWLSSSIPLMLDFQRIWAGNTLYLFLCVFFWDLLM